MDFFLIITGANAKHSIQHTAYCHRFRNFFPESNTTGTYSSSRQAGLNTSLLEKAYYVLSSIRLSIKRFPKIIFIY